MSETAEPTSPQRLLLRAALGEGDAVERAWQQWRAEIDFDDIDYASQRLVPLVRRNLIDHGVNDPLLHRMKGLHRFFWSKNQLRFRMLSTVAQAFAREEIPLMALKGVPLALVYYADAGLRPMSDFDLLVPFADADRAVALLLAEGWLQDEPGSIYRSAGVVDTEARHGACFRKDDQECDLHWHLLYDGWWPEADAGLWERSVPLEVHQQQLRAPSPADMIFHLLVHGATYNELPPFRWFADLAILLRQEDLPIDWSVLEERARSLLLVGVVREMIEAFEVLVPGLLPREPLERLRALPVSRLERRELARRLWDEDYRYTPLGRWAQFRRRYPHAGIGGVLKHGPDFLKTVWGLESSWSLPSTLLLQALPSYLGRLAGRSAGASASRATPR
ncbi:MAG: nucleotidyltransferase family protein [Acidobacteriota bacterium]